MTTDDSTYTRRPGLNAVTMDGELVMMGLEQGAYYGLRDVAASVWNHLAEPQTLAGLSALVAAEYDVTPEACTPDLVAFLDEMLAKSLIEPST